MIDRTKTKGPKMTFKYIVKLATMDGVKQYEGSAEDVATLISMDFDFKCTRCMVRNWAESKDTYYRKCWRV